MRISLCLLSLTPLITLTTSHELKFVQAIWRHGDRAPLDYPYPNDAYTEDYWPRGWAELTDIGMRQLRELGQYFRTRYGIFIEDNFNVKQVYMRSSDVDRALVSAQSFFYGLYPTNGSTSINNNIDWQPIPIHANSPGEVDLYCHSTSMDCPNGQKLRDNNQEANRVLYDKEFADVFALLAQPNATGITDFNFMDVSAVYDVSREITHGLVDKQPWWWLNKTWPNHGGRTTQAICNDLRRIKMLSDFGSYETGQLYAGFLLNEWITNALAVANGTQVSPSRMKLFSSHDTVQMALMFAMGVGNNLMPPYASCFMMEVYKEDNGDFTAELYYRNDTTAEPSRLSIPGCGNPCLVSSLPELYSRAVIKTPEDVKQQCGVPKTPCNSGSLMQGVLSIFTVLWVTFNWL